MVLFIYNAVHRDTRAEEEYEKVDKYQNLAWLLKRLWKVNNNTMQIVVSALGTTPKSLEPAESWDNSEHRVTSESCTPGNIMNTQGTRYWTV